LIVIKIVLLRLNTVTKSDCAGGIFFFFLVLIVIKDILPRLDAVTQSDCAGAVLFRRGLFNSMFVNMRTEQKFRKKKK